MIKQSKEENNLISCKSVELIDKRYKQQLLVRLRMVTFGEVLQISEY